MTASPPFLGFPDRLADGRMPRAVIFGAGHGSTYPGNDSSGHALAADAIRMERGSSSPSTATASIPASCRAWPRARPAASPTRR